MRPERFTDVIRARARSLAPRRIAAAALLLAAAMLPAALPEPAIAANGFIFLSRLDSYGGYNDVWGYKDPATGKEYAILGTTTGTSIVNVSDPFHPYETGFIPGMPSIWRDMHTYQGRAYVVSEGSDSTGGGGLQIVSLADPEAPFLIRKKHAFTAHTLWIDEAAGAAYCNGVAGFASGFRIYDLRVNPDNPTINQDVPGEYVHDCWVGGGVAYTADINSGGQMRVLDVSAIPAGTSFSQTGIANYPNGATHNTWPHPDGTHVLTTDERGGGTVRVWDVSVPSSIIQVAQIPAVSGTSVHNVYMKGTTAYCAWYAAGIRAYDLANPLAPTLLGFYDTSPSSNGFNGCWSVYPFLPSGVIACADISEGLVLVAHVGSSGFIAGTVTAQSGGAPIASAKVRVPGFYDKQVLTSPSGAYNFELPAGAATVIVSFPGYRADTTVVSISGGATTTHDVALASAPTGVPGAGSTPLLEAFSQARPNPSSGASGIELGLSRAGDVAAEVYDLAGRRVRILASGTLPAGRTTLRWDARDDQGRDVAAGTYFFRVTAAGEERSARLTIVR